MTYGLSNAVIGLADGNKPVSEGIDSLMMCGVDVCTAFVNLIEKISAVAAGMVYVVKLVAVNPPVVLSGS